MLQIQPENYFAIEIHVKFMEQVLKQNIIIKQYNPLIMFTQHFTITHFNQFTALLLGLCLLKL